MEASKIAEWMVQRLTSDAARDDWRDLIAAGAEAWLDQPVGTVLPAAVYERAVHAVVTEQRLNELARGGLRLAAVELLAELEDDEAPLDRHLDEVARVRLDGLISRPGLIDESWIDVVFSQKATEELFAETLFRALEDFSEAIPTLMQAATPAALGRIASRLQGATGGVRDRMREELKGRLEPEIRRFVQKATRRLLDGTATLVKSSLDREGSMQARKNLLRHALSRPTSMYLRHLDASARSELEAVASTLAASESAREEARGRLLSLHRRLLERFGGTSVRAMLAAHDIELDLDAELLADLTWPSVQAMAKSGLPPIMERIAAELAVALDADADA